VLSPSATLLTFQRSGLLRRLRGDGRHLGVTELRVLGHVSVTHILGGSRCSHGSHGKIGYERVWRIIRTESSTTDVVSRRSLKFTQFTALRVIRIFKTFGWERLLGTSSHIRVGKHHRIQRGRAVLDLVRVIVVTILGEVELAGVQARSEESVEPQSLLLYSLLEAAKEPEDSSNTNIGLNRGSRGKKQQGQKAGFREGFRHSCFIAFERSLHTHSF
jgi:hypothetical protein